MAPVFWRGVHTMGAGGRFPIVMGFVYFRTAAPL